MEIVGRQRSHLIEDVDEDIGSVSGKACAGDSIGSQQGAALFYRFQELVFIRNFDSLGSSYDNGLELFRAHDSSQSTASRCAVLIVHDIGEHGEIFTCGTDAGHFRVRVCFGEKPIRGIVRVFAPELGGIA